MHSKVLISCSGALLAIAGTATPGLARTHHHGPTLRQSTPAERAQTAELNRQQLSQAQNASTASGNSNLMTEPTSYQRSVGSSGMSGNASGNAGGSTSGPGAGAGEDQNVGAPSANPPTNLQGSPSVTQPPANNSTPE